MMKHLLTRCFLVVVAALVAGGLPARAWAQTPNTTPALVLNKGDRIVVVGNTFVERMGLFGNFETMLVSQRPELELTVRLLGWSADEVTRVHLRLPANPFRQADWLHYLQPRPLNFGDMDTHLAKQKADVVVACFGLNESFRGEAGLNGFRSDLRAFVLRLRDQQFNGHSPPRIVLVSPIPYEQISPLLPDAGPRNKDLAAYTEAMRQVAAEENVAFIDLFHPLLPLMGDPSAERMTINGIHLTRYGDWVAARAMLRQLGMGQPWQVEVDAATLQTQAKGARVPPAERRGTTIVLEINDLKLPLPPPAGARLHKPVRDELPRIVVRGLKPGRYRLEMNGHEVATADADQWNRGVRLASGPVFEKAERLRETVNEKNEQFFYRWRPVNGEYIYGRRKEPFGVVNFPKEMQQLDAMVAELDRKIHSQSQPAQTLHCELSPAQSK